MNEKTVDKSNAPELAHLAQSLSEKSRGMASGFGFRLKEERKRLRMSQSEFGMIAGIRRLAQQQYEQEKSSPSITYLSKIMVAGADLDYLLFGQRSVTGINRDAMERIEHRAFEMMESLAIEHADEKPPIETRWTWFRVFRNYLIQVERGGLPDDISPAFVASLFSRCLG